MARFEFSAEDVVGTTGADALFQLGLMYCTGREVEIDLIQAHKWFNLAALRGNETAKQYRLDISREMTKKDIATAQRGAREWLKLN